MSMHDQEIPIGETWPIGVSFLDTDGSAYDMTGKTGKWRAKRVTATAVEIEIDTDDSEFSWATRGSGTGTLTIPSNTTKTAGKYKAEAFIEDASDPVVRRKVGEAWWTFKTPETGSF